MERCDAVEGGDSSDGEWEEEYIMAVIPGKGLVSPSSRISIAVRTRGVILIQDIYTAFKVTLQMIGLI
tara:strand:+ start:160 stop:363 length:204 start_codon:yes stop_codon:yes gene_type:complete